jgi:alpha-amylase/alpha-mannosidase (GH57 family)
MKKVQFIFGIHNHQPVGNFDNVFHDACDRSYLPFLQVLEKYPEISMAFHFSGSLIEWLEEHRPEVLNLFKKLVDRGNIEVLGSGFYEPILAMIPEADRVGQISKMNDWALDRLNYEIKGNWLTERVWEPHLAHSLNQAGIDYMVVDDYHFLTTGADPQKLNGYYFTEQEGKVLGVFPISQKMRYAMPFEDPQVAIDILKSYASDDGENLVVMADDGEKFGIWPGTWETVYGQKWLERFFSLLSENSDSIITTTFKKYYSNHRPKDLVYIPTSSYFEMSQWTLRTDLGKQMDHFIHDLENQGKGEESRPFISGGMWRNFFTKYPESNWMQKRVQFLSLNLSQLESKGGIPLQLRDDLYRAQCNCAYWHGVFGGLYLPHLRHAIFEHLLKAEERFLASGGSFPGLVDLDSDGVEEYRLRSDNVQLFISADTGQIREIDWLPSFFNVTNYLQRYSEHYHEKLALASNDPNASGSIHDIVLTKEEGLQDKLFVDTYKRHGLIDHIFDTHQTQKHYYRAALHENYSRVSSSVKQSEAGVQINTSGFVDQSEITIEKKLELHHNDLSISISIHNQGKKNINQLYGLELNFGLLGGNSPDRYYLVNNKNCGSLNSHGDEADVQTLALVNEWDNFKINLNFSKKCQLWRAPIETISMSEAGFERVYQASAVLPHWKLNLSPGESLELEILLSINKFTN